MNTIYLVRSILDCVDRELVCKQTHVKVCNLEPSKGTVVLLLSILTSAAMIGYKAARTLAFAYCSDCHRHGLARPHRDSCVEVFAALYPRPTSIDCFECFC